MRAKGATPPAEGTTPPADATPAAEGTTPAAGGVARSARRRLPAALGPVTDLVLLAVVTVLIGRYCTAFTGFPKGYDVWGHMSKVRMAVDGFPDINWNDEWYAGQPAFLGSYPPGYHFLVGGLSWITGWSLPDSMLVLGAAAIITLLSGCYLLAYGVTGSRAVGLLSAGLLLASPTMWDQVVELGLYPRFTALAVGALAAGCAALYRRSPNRLRATTTVLVLAGALATHPVSGIISSGVVAWVLLNAGEPGFKARVVRAVATAGAAMAVCGFFYVPLVLVPRPQSGFTDFEVPLRMDELGWPGDGRLDTLPPVMLIGVLVASGGIALALARPRWRGSRLADVAVVPSGDRGDGITAGALEEAIEWSVRWDRHLPDVRLAAGLAVASGIAIGYGLLGYFVEHFAYYVNGLQPRDLLAYPAWLLSAALGIGMYVSVRHRRRHLRRATAVVSAALVGACLAQTVALLPSGVRDSSGVAQDAMTALLPAEAHGDDDHRIFGVSDGTSRWINAITDTPQLRGYDDHGNLHLDWQFWLEHTVTSRSTHTTAQQLRFLLDYYAARWLLTDTTQARANLATHPADFAHLGREVVYADVNIWEYRYAHPISTAVTAPTVLVIGDDAHYDLLLRTLALANVGVDRLLPVRGPTTLTEVTAAQLRPYQTVLIYGAAPGERPATAAFAGYARSGGHLVLDVGDSRAADAIGRAVGSPVKVTHLARMADRWRFTGTGAGSASRFSPPLYNGLLPWDVRTPTSGVSGEVLLAATGLPVLVRGRAGAGDITWSGLNLPYHATTFADPDEVAFLARLLGAADAAEPVTPVVRTRPDPQHRDVILPPGINQALLREYVSEDWHASVDGRDLPMLVAGPGMMFLRVPDHTSPVTIELVYRFSPAEHAGVAVSVLALLGVVGYAAGGGPPLRRLLVRLRHLPGRQRRLLVRLRRMLAWLQRLLD